MTKTQAEIIQMIAKLPLSERKELVEHVRDTMLLDDTFYEAMTPEQRTHLSEGIAQADRGEGEDAGVVIERLSRRLGIPSA